MNTPIRLSKQRQVTVTPEQRGDKKYFQSLSVFDLTFMRYDAKKFEDTELMDLVDEELDRRDNPAPEEGLF